MVQNGQRKEQEDSVIRCTCYTKTLPKYLEVHTVDEMFSSDSTLRIFKDGGNVGPCLGIPLVTGGLGFFLYLLWFGLSHSESRNAPIAPLFSLIGLAIAFVGANQFAHRRGVVLNSKSRTCRYYDTSSGYGDDETYSDDDLGSVIIEPITVTRHTVLQSTEYAVGFRPKSGGGFNIRAYSDREKAREFAAGIAGFLAIDLYSENDDKS